jgi:hypothetical protein
MVGELEQLELMVGFFKPMWLLNFEFTCSCNIVLLVGKYDYWYMISFTKWVGWGPEAVVVYRNIDKYRGFSIIDISIFLFLFFCYFDIPKSIRYFWRFKGFLMISDGFSIPTSAQYNSTHCCFC